VLEGEADRYLVVLFGGVLPMEPLYEDPVAARLLDGLRSLGQVVVDDVSGLAVNIAARTMAYGKPGEILLTTSTAQGALGSDIQLESHGLHQLEGVDGPGNCTACSARDLSWCDPAQSSNRTISASIFWRFNTRMSAPASSASAAMAISAAKNLRW
jgi:hypothetical protein